MAVINIYTTAGGDGSIQSDGGVGDWDTPHDATTGTTGDGTETTIECGVDFTDKYYIKRAFLPFDTSVLPNDATIISVTVNLYVTAVNDTDNDGDDWVNIVGPTTQASATALSTADFDQCGSINNPAEIATRIDIGNINTSAYNVWTLNATGIALISKTGNTLLGAREGHDAIDSSTTGSKITFYSSDNATNKPYLEVTYSVPGGSSAFFSTGGLTIL